MRNQLLKTDCRDMGAYLQAVRSRLFVVRNQPVLLAQDVAALYGVEPREVGQAIRNNPDKFPEGYVLDLTKEETEVLKSKVLVRSGGSHQSFLTCVLPQLNVCSKFHGFESIDRGLVLGIVLYFKSQ